MASNPDFVQYVLDQCGGAGEVTARKMFGDYTLYLEGKVIGLISDNGLYLKPTDAARQLLRTVDMRPPYQGAKECFYIEDLDDRDHLAALVAATCRALPAPKPKKKRP